MTNEFTMPMFRDFVPRKMQPWIYLFIAFTFQLSGGAYLGALNQMIGGTSLLREDILMCMYANLAGMAIYFPLLFRMKFRFTNKTLLTASALGVMACNLLAPHITFLPLLWAVCFFSGMCKIQGTFECMSNIQLWMTPKRDFTVFFPVLHIVILCSIQLSDLITTYLMYYYNWTYMHLFIAGLMLVVVLIQTSCVRHFRIMRKFPLFGIDWMGAMLWAALLLEITYFFNYADLLDWWNSPTLCRLAVFIIINAAACLHRMFTIRHPFFEPAMWKYRHLLPILGLITVVEAFLATEHVLEEVYYEEVMKYEEMVSVQLDWYAIIGILCGCLFSYWWMHIKHYNYIRLITIGLGVLALYLIGFYSTISTDIHISYLSVPVLCRGFAYAVLSITFMMCLEEIMTFRHFFQALSVFNMLHMVMGGVLGCAIYATGLAYYMPCNMARYGSDIDATAVDTNSFYPGEYMSGFISKMMEISIKQIYGWVIYACLLLFILFLLYKMPVRKTLKKMPYWKIVRRQVKKTYWRTSHAPSV